MTVGTGLTVVFTRGSNGDVDVDGDGGDFSNGGGRSRLNSEGDGWGVLTVTVTVGEGLFSPYIKRVPLKTFFFKFCFRNISVFSAYKLKNSCPYPP